MDKQAVCALLTSAGIPHEIVGHPAVFTVAEADALALPHPESGAKNLFLRDDKKQHYYLLTVRDRLPVDLRAFQHQIGSRRLSFASPDDLMRLLGLIPGSVTPFGALNDATHAVSVFIDAWFEDRLIAVHPNENTATVYLRGSDLAHILRMHGSSAAFIDLEQTKEQLT